MSRVHHLGHGIWCYACQEVHEGTDGCEHELGRKDGIQIHRDGGYITDPADMGHFSPHQFIEVDGFEQCAECGATKIPAQLVDDEEVSA